MHVAGNLTDPDHGILKGRQFLIHDRDRLFTKQFKATLKVRGTCLQDTQVESQPERLLRERFVQTIKYECTDKMIFFGQKRVTYVISDFMIYYHEERPHLSWATGGSWGLLPNTRQRVHLLPRADWRASQELLPKSSMNGLRRNMSAGWGSEKVESNLRQPN
jgi:Integrase core domain